MDSTYPPYARSIHHDGSSRYVRPNHDLHLGDRVTQGDPVTLRLRAAPDAPIERVLLRTCPDGEQRYADMTPEPVEPSAPCRWWRGTLSMSMPSVAYRFLLFTSDGVFWLTGSGLQRHTPTDAEDFRLLADYAAPTWVRDSVFYQIFPDRFADGDPSHNVRDGEFVYLGQEVCARRWGEPPSPDGRTSMLEFYGGDLAGVEEKLDYLADLGVNALYLNPIFTAHSNHRYDVIDYYAVDPHLGGDEALVSLRRATAQRGMRLILDVVPNHCGWAHPWFQAALADPQAPTAEYFSFHQHPHDYASWLGVKLLPKLNYRSAALREVMYAGPDAVFCHWLRPPFSVDGWRLDVANMLGRQGAEQLGGEVGRGIRRAVKAENPQAYLLGENFFDGSAQLQGDRWDATMNYVGFTWPVRHWLGRFQAHQFGWPEPVVSEPPWPTQALVDTWAAHRAAIPWTIARQQFNLLGSHDIPRPLSAVGGDPGLNRLAVGLMLTYVGVPSVYYGDEVGLSGEGAAVRAPMPWEPSAWDQDLRQFYQTLIHLRRGSPALIGGGFQVLLVEEDSLAYLRDSDQELVVVVGHRGPGERPAGPLPVAHGAVPEGLEFVEALSGKRATVSGGHLPLPAMSPGVGVWRARITTQP